MKAILKTISLMLITGIILLVMACNNNKSPEKMTEQNNNPFFRKEKNYPITILQEMPF